jgi:pimeloyl-ACP methyl ester carboxylesterase
MATFVLVHGGWTGAHGWRTVRRLLAGAGHEVFTPSLTGIGERVHLVSPQVNLTTHVHDVVNQVLFEDLADVVLVGHSYGGFVAAGAVLHVHDRIRELVFLDAFVPSDGDSVFGLSGRPGPPIIEVGDGWLIPPFPREYDDPAEGAWQTARRVPHPMGCFVEPVRLAKPLEDYDFGLSYIKATAEPRDAPGGAAFWDAAAHARDSGRWRHYEIETNHMVPSNRPHELAGLLAEIAGSEAR